MKLSDLVDTSNAIANVGGRLEKIDRLATLLKRLPPDEIDTAIAFLSGSIPQGRIGIGPSVAWGARSTAPADGSTLDLPDVHHVFDRIAAMSGRGSAGDRAGLLRDLFSRATRDEQDFLARLLVGELRQGALEGIAVEAVARASSIPAVKVRRAVMMAGDLRPVATAALTGGEAALSGFIVQIMKPVKPMLADSAEDVGDALERLFPGKGPRTNIGPAAVEYKLDGARIQVHKAGDDVRVFSRHLREVTAAVPEIVEIVRAWPAREAILDGEIIALRPDGSPQPFQQTMRRFGRKLDVDALRHELPLTPAFFDCLYVDGTSLIDEPLSVRYDALANLAPPELVVPRVVGATRQEAEAFEEQALRRGHEGVMAKALDAPYAAGRRGQAWLKIKRAVTLDLVILAVEWGSGRRRGWLSNLHLGARDPQHGGFVMLGKTFKGMTDEMLAWQTRALLDLEIARDSHVVHVRPELVVEVAFNDVQGSPQYPGGLALRFARVKRYRTDKTAAEADTIDTVRRIHAQTTRQDDITSS